MATPHLRDDAVDTVDYAHRSPGCSAGMLSARILLQHVREAPVVHAWASMDAVAADHDGDSVHPVYHPFYPVKPALRRVDGLSAVVQRDDRVRSIAHATKHIVERVAEHDR